jgi:spermidine synthase
MCLRSNKLTLFSTTPSFADNLVKSDHSLDADLLAIYQKVNQAFFPSTYSPPPSEEHTHFQALSTEEKQYMLIRNPLLLSRLFIRHANISQLESLFASQQPIRILDIGCGYAANLMGVLAYFGLDRVDYLGVDISRENIRSAALAYNQFSQVSFIACDAVTFLENQGKRSKQYDLILIQHPNFQEEASQTVFEKIFFSLNLVMTDSTTLYTTFYSKSELDYFRTRVQPRVDLLNHAVIHQPDTYSDTAKFIDRTSNEQQAAEQYILLVPPKNQEPQKRMHCTAS